jgi:hypothetical protein
MKLLFYACAISSLLLLALMLPSACAPSEEAKEQHAAHRVG